MAKEFKKIEDAFEYVKEGIEQGRFKPEEVRKIAVIKARQGKDGEEIKTILPSGLEELKGTVQIDESTGRPGWVATNPAGEEYIIKDSDFQKMYEEIPEKPGEFRKTVPSLSVKIDEDIAFTNKYGEEMKVEAGGHLIFFDGARGVLGNRTYGVAAEAWDTYEQTGKAPEETLKQVMELLGIESKIINPELSPEQLANDEDARNASEKFDREVRNNVLGKNENSLENK